MNLDVREYISLVDLFNAILNGLYEHGGRHFILVLKSVEIHQGGHNIETMPKMLQFTRKPVDCDIAATLNVMPRPAKQHRSYNNVSAMQVALKDLPNKFFPPFVLLRR